MLTMMLLLVAVEFDLFHSKFAFFVFRPLVCLNLFLKTPERQAAAAAAAAVITNMSIIIVSSSKHVWK